jgi:hypothetical protein
VGPHGRHERRLANTSANGGATAFSLATDTASLTVTAVNDPPTLAALPGATVAEDSGPHVVGLSGIGAGGGEGQTLQVTATSSNPALVPHPAVTYLSGSATGTLQFAPNPDAFGTATITVTVRDAGLNGVLGDGDDAVTTRQFAVTVSPVPDAPVANPNTYSANGIVPLTVLGSGVLGNDADADGDALTAVLVSSTSNGLLTFLPTGRSPTPRPSASAAWTRSPTGRSIRPGGRPRPPRSPSTSRR